MTSLSRWIDAVDQWYSSDISGLIETVRGGGSNETSAEAKCDKNTELPSVSNDLSIFRTARMVDPDQSNAQGTQDQSPMSFASILNAIYACFKKKRVGPDTSSSGEPSGSQDVPPGPAGTSGNPAPKGRPATGHPRGRDQPGNEGTNNESVPGEQQNETGGPSGSEPTPPRRGRPPTGHPKGRGQPEDDEPKDGDEETKSEDDELKDEDANPTDEPARPGSPRQAKAKSDQHGEDLFPTTPHHSDIFNPAGDMERPEDDSPNWLDIIRDQTEENYSLYGFGF